MEKKDYAMVKALKSFRIYIFHSKIIAYIPNSIVKEILSQPDIDGWLKYKNMTLKSNLPS
jgi:hypothetical protein